MAERQKEHERYGSTGTRPAAEDLRIRRLLDDVSDGDGDAIDGLFDLLYEELRVLARRQRRRWRGDHTLDTTALLHEAYLKLRRQDRIPTASRNHFYALASAAMRHILVNYAERKRAAKRGGGVVPVSLTRIASVVPAVRSGADATDRLAALDLALRGLERTSARTARVVECRLFGGLTIDETSAALDVSPRTVKRDWAFALAWLKRALHEGE